MMATMRFFARNCGWMVLLVGTAITTPAVGAIVSFSGSADVQAQEFLNDAPGESKSQSAAFPGSQATLPLQVVAVIKSGAGKFPSAAGVAAQFADPTELSTPNPEEFAINLTLNSVDPAVRYQATAHSQEQREVLFSPGELGATSQAGDTERLRGRFFVDGALNVIAVAADRDLTGAFVRLTVTVVKSAAGQSDETVFSGNVELRGSAGGQVVVAADGDFPTNRLILTDLAGISQNFAAFRVLIIPSVQIDYDYAAIVGQTFTLTATVQVEAANVPDNVGVSAVIGTPTDTLSEIIGFTNGSSAAAKYVDEIRSERDNPTGDPALPQTTPAAGLPLCGLFGFEGLLAVAGIIGLKMRMRR